MILALLLAWVGTANYLWIGLRQIANGVPSITAGIQVWNIFPSPLPLS